MSAHVHLTLYLGLVPVLAPREVLEALRGVEITHSDEGRSGIQLAFAAGRTKGSLDDPIVAHEKLRVFTRVIVVISLAGTSTVLFDGLLTNQQFAPSAQPGASTFTVTGEDVSLLMDQVEITAEYPQMNEEARVVTILGRYGAVGIVPAIVPPTFLRTILSLEQTPQQNGTDYAYIASLAEQFGYVFYLMPGPAVGANTAYWGPPIRTGAAQKALTFNMGHASNVASIDFQHDATKPKLNTGTVQVAGLAIPFATSGSTRLPALASHPTLPTYLAHAHTKIMVIGGGDPSTSDLDATTALWKAQAETDASTDAVATASGDLDVLRYGGVLAPRSLVAVRGCGSSFDGGWYVKSVTHSIKRGEYHQKFSLSREGLGSTLKKVSA